MVGLIRKYASMAFSHLDASEIFPENRPGRAVLISAVRVVVAGVCVDMAVAGGVVVIGLVAGGTKVAGCTAIGLGVGRGVLEVRGVTALSRGLLELGSGLMSSGSRLILGLRWDMLTKGF